MCGKVCVGKTTLAAELADYVLSSDELMISLFGIDAGDGVIGKYVNKVKYYLYEKAADMAKKLDITVALDMGLWTAKGRDAARKFFTERGIPYEIHYIHVNDDMEWYRRINKRDYDVNSNKVKAYYVTGSLRSKSDDWFQIPSENETDVIWYNITDTVKETVTA